MVSAGILMTLSCSVRTRCQTASWAANRSIGNEGRFSATGCNQDSFDPMNEHPHIPKAKTAVVSVTAAICGLPFYRLGRLQLLDSSGAQAFTARCLMGGFVPQIHKKLGPFRTLRPGQDGAGLGLASS